MANTLAWLQFVSLSPLPLSCLVSSHLVFPPHELFRSLILTRLVSSPLICRISPSFFLSLFLQYTHMVSSPLISHLISSHLISSAFILPYLVSSPPFSSSLLSSHLVSSLLVLSLLISSCLLLYHLI